MFKVSVLIGRIDGIGLQFGPNNVLQQYQPATIDNRQKVDEIAKAFGKDAVF